MLKEYQQFEFLGKLTFVKAVMEPPFKLVADMHDEACFYFVKTGHSKIYTPTEEISLNADEGVVLHCGKYINEYLKSSDAEYCEAIAIHLFPDVIKLIYDNEFPDFLLNVNKIEPVQYEFTEASSLLENYIKSLEFYFNNPSLVSDELLKLKLKELILLLSKTNNAKVIQSLVSGTFNPLEAEFKEVVESNLYNSLSSSDLAELCNLSLSSFKREFEKHYKTSPAKYIKKRKLEKAARLLKKEGLRISDIAFDCGFNDLAHFSRSFQKAYGKTPSNYRLSVLSSLPN